MDTSTRRPVDTVDTDETRELPAVTVWLLNDDIDTFSEVENQLQIALDCTRAEAERFALLAHSFGSTMIFRGSLDVCFNVACVLHDIDLLYEISVE